MCIYRGYMKFICQLCQGEVCSEANDATTDDDDQGGQSMIVEGSLADKPNEPKTTAQCSGL